MVIAAVWSDEPEVGADGSTHGVYLAASASPTLVRRGTLLALFCPATSWSVSPCEAGGNMREQTRIHEAFTYLIVRDAAAAIEFYTNVFGAAETERIDYHGKIGHAELMFGPTKIMLADEFPDSGIRSPLAFGGTGSRVHLHVDDVDELAARAAAAGATILYGPSDEPHGERQCRLRDPFGHEWLLGHKIEQLSMDEIKRRYAQQSPRSS